MAQTGALTAKDEFRNTSGGFVGATAIGPHGEHRGIAVEPHGSVFLSEDEQILTANAPRQDADNPFLPQPYKEYDDKGDLVDEGVRPLLALVRRGTEVKNRRPLGVADESKPAPAPEPEEADVQETGAEPIPEGEPDEGHNAPGEEVATPVARRRRTKATV